MFYMCTHVLGVYRVYHRIDSIIFVDSNNVTIMIFVLLPFFLPFLFYYYIHLFSHSFYTFFIVYFLNRTGDLKFDPLGLKPTDPRAFNLIQTKELNNGRLAMLAIAGIVAQELVTNQPIF